MATHSSILAWKISWTEEPGGLHPWGRKEWGMTEQLTLTYLLNIYTGFTDFRKKTLQVVYRSHPVILSAHSIYRTYHC